MNTPEDNLARHRFKHAIRQVISNYHQAYIDFYPDDPFSYERQGYILFADGQYKLAFQRMNDTASFGIDKSRIWTTLARSGVALWKEKQDWDFLWQAKFAFEYALYHMEVLMSPSLIFEYTFVLEKVGEIHPAIHALGQLLVKFPNWTQIHQVKFRLCVLYWHLLHHRDSYQDYHDRIESDAYAKRQRWKICIEMLDELMLTQQDEHLYFQWLYLSTRMKDDIPSARMKKKAWKSFIELKHLIASMGICRPTKDDDVKVDDKDNDPESLSCFDQPQYWLDLSVYFSTVAKEPMLAIDAHKHMLKLVFTQLASGELPPIERNPVSFAQEPLSTYHETLGHFYAEGCNDMTGAVVAMDRALVYGPYVPSTRETLIEWYGEKYRPIFDLEEQSQRRIAKQCRHNWRQDAVVRHEHALVRKAEKAHRQHPHSDLEARQVLRQLVPGQYQQKFLLEQMMCRKLQRHVREHLTQVRAQRRLDQARDREIAQCRAHLAKHPFHAYYRDRLAKYCPLTYGLRCTQEVTLAQWVQKWTRGFLMRCQFFATDRELLQRHQCRRRQEQRVALLIQRRYREHRTNSLTRASTVLAQTQVRLATNLQRLYWKKRQTLTNVVLEKRKRDDAQVSLHRKKKAVKIIERTWLRYVRDFRGEFGRRGALAENLWPGGSWFGDQQENQDNHSTLTESQALVRQAHVAREEAARQLQRIFRGRHTRLCLSNVVRILALAEPSALVTIQRDFIHRCANSPTLSIGTISREHFQARPLALFRGDAQYWQCWLDHRMICTTGLDAGQWQDLAPRLNAAKMITHLLVFPGSCEQDGLLALVQALGVNASLEVLAIGKNGIGLDSPWCPSMAQLGSVLARMNFHLKELVIESNPVEDSGALHLSTSLCDYFAGAYGSLNVLRLRHCELGNAGATAMADVLKVSKHLRILDLYGNVDIGNEGALALAKGLELAFGLEELNVGNNGIGSSGALAIVESVLTNVRIRPGNHQLKRLLMSNNHLLNDVIPGFEKLLCLGKLVRLELAGNLIHPTDIARLENLTKHHHRHHRSTSHKVVKKLDPKISKAKSFEAQKLKCINQAHVHFKHRRRGRVETPIKKDKTTRSPNQLLREQRVSQSIKSLAKTKSIQTTEAILRPNRRQKMDQPLSGIVPSSRILQSPTNTPLHNARRRAKSIDSNLPLHQAL